MKFISGSEFPLGWKGVNFHSVFSNACSKKFKVMLQFFIGYMKILSIPELALDEHKRM